MEEPKNEMNDRMDRFRLFLRNNGFYIALVVCLVVIGGAILLLALDKPAEEEAEAQSSDPIVIVGQSNDERLQELLHAPTIRPASGVIQNQSQVTDKMPIHLPIRRHFSPRYASRTARAPPRIATLNGPVTTPTILLM